VRVAPTAPLRDLLAPDRAPRFGHAAGGSAGGTGDRRADPLADVGVTHLQIGVLGLRAGAAAVNPQLVGELVEMPVGASQQVLGGDGGVA
jgi:hypothetical protein